MHYCPHCHRRYQRKTYFERHTVVCDILTKSKKERKVESEEQADTPTLRDLYRVIMELAVKYNHLEQKIQEMAKVVSIKKQKLNIIDWLTITHSTSTDYKSWLDSMAVTREDLNVVFEVDYVAGVLSVLKHNLLLEDEMRPLRAFIVKDSVFYIFEQEHKQWSTMDDEIYMNLMHYIDKKLMTAFGIWQTENKDNMYLDDFTLIYAKNVKKIMASREALYPRIKKEFYKYLRVDLPDAL